MNKIYKVIWSKAKHTYVVASEIAKGHTKGETTGKGLKKLAAAMLVAAALLSPSFAWAADTTVKVKDTSETEQTVYTKDGADGTFVKKGSDNGTSLTIGASNSEKSFSHQYVTGAKTDYDGNNGTVVTQVTGPSSSISIKVGNADSLTYNFQNYSEVKTTREEGTTFTYHYENGAQTIDNNTTIKGNTVTTGSVNASNGVVDGTTQDGTSVQKAKTVGQNLNALDERITNVKEYVLSETNRNYVSKTDATFAEDGAIVKKANTIGENVANLDAALAKETADRLGADAAQDKRINEAAAGIAAVNTALATQVDKLNQQDSNETATRAAKDTELENSISTIQSGNTVSEDGNYIKASNTVGENLSALDTGLNDRITAVKEFLQTETENRYVSKDSLASELEVKAAGVVKEDQTIGENVTALGKALDAETNARIWADKSQDKRINEAAAGIAAVNTALATQVDNLNKQDANEAATRAAADAAETAGRVAADTKLVEATNGGLSLDNDNVLQKTKTEISSTGEVTTSKEAATTLVINKDAHNQVKIDSEGVTVGTSSTQMDAEGFTAGGHDYKAAGAALMSDGRIKGANGKFTVDTNGNIKTNGGFIQTGGGNMNTQGGEVRTNGGKVATSGGEINTGSGDIKTVGGDILTAGGKLNTSGGDIVAGTGDISGHDITASGVLSGDSLTVANGMTGRSLTLTGGDLDAGAGTIKTTGEVDAGTLNVSGKATVKDLEVKGEFKAETLTSWVDANNNTTINGGNVTSVNSKVDTDDGRTYTSSSKLTEKGRTDTAANGTTRNVSTQTASESGSTISSLADEKQKSYITQNLKKILQGIQNGDNATTVNQTETGIKSTATDGKNTASTNLSNKGFNTYATDGTNKTYTKQTATDIKNTAENGTISNSAKDLVNKATGDMTNTVGGKLLNDVAGDMENKVGGKLTTTVTGKTTENYNGGLETTVTGEEKHTVNGKQTNSITGDQVNTIGGKLTTTVTGDVTEDYKSNLSTTVGGNQTTTVTGDSSLTAENISNEAKNRITNTALDVETDAKSSIVNKVSNDAGSNTSTQLSYQTTEEMSQADGKTASYLRGAAEEKSQLTDGAKKTTIDTIAGQTNTNITDGKKISNSLQNADKIASSVTDGTNTTVVNQDAKSLASSITDGTRVNNTSSTVDKSEQLIKVDDTHFYAETKTVDKAEEALKSGTTLIDIVKDTKTATVSSAVTDGKTITGISQNAKDINLSAADGTIANSAKNINNTAAEKLSNSAAEIENKATTSINNSVGDNVSSSMTTNKITESVKDGTKSNTFTKTADKDINTVTDGTNTSTESQLAGSVNTSLKEVDAEGKTTKSLNNVKTVSEDTTKITDTTKNAFSSSSQKADSITSTVKDMGKGTISERSQTVSQVQDKVGTTTVTTTNGLTKLTNEAGTHNTQMDFAEVLKDLGVRGNATVDGNTTLGKEGADTTLTVNSTSTFNKDVTMKANATVERNLTVKGDTTMEGSATVKKDLTVDGATNLKGDAIIGTDENNTLTVNSKSTFNNGVTVKGGTTTDTLHVTSTATFDDIVTMKSDLNVGGNAKVAGDVTAKSFKVGENTYIDKDGINANGHVIQNVGQGKISAGSTDAVTGGQLYETNTRVTGLETRVDKLDNKIDKVGANAAAMANLHPLEFDEDSKWNIAAAVGSSGSETASAVGVFYRPNENVMVNASVAMGTGENMFGGGVSLRLGHGGNKAKEAQMKAAAKENRELRAKVDDLTARMDALLSVLNPNMSKDFPDVPENHWAYEAVSRLAGNGIVEGYEDGKYHGERQMTRYEMAEIIYNALSKGAKAEKKLVEEFRPELQAIAAQKKA